MCTANRIPIGHSSVQIKAPRVTTIEYIHSLLSHSLVAVAVAAKATTMSSGAHQTPESRAPIRISLRFSRCSRFFSLTLFRNNFFYFYIFVRSGAMFMRGLVVLVVVVVATAWRGALFLRDANELRSNCVRENEHCSVCPIY